ncbi:hypothetical protein CFA77_16355 [Hyphomonas sp. KY3]|nr:hypothetical protein CFA77_16355 [Hyphomonas sp. KY3]
MADDARAIPYEEWVKQTPPTFYNDVVEAAYRRDVVARIAHKHDIFDFEHIKTLWAQLRHAGQKFLPMSAAETERQTLKAIRSSLLNIEALTNELSTELSKALEPSEAEMSLAGLIRQAEIKIRADIERQRPKEQIPSSSTSRLEKTLS